MGFFPRLQKRITGNASSVSITSASGVQRVTFAVPRLAHIESMELSVGVAIPGATADNVTFTKLKDGLAGVVSKVTFNAGNYDYINAVSGGSLLRYANNIDVLDYKTVKAIALGTTADVAVGYDPELGPQAAMLMERAIAETLRIPMYFGHPQIMEPNNAPLMVPMGKFSTDGTVTVDFAQLADFVTLGSGTTTVTLTPVLVVNYRVLPDSVPHFRHVLGEKQETVTVTGETEFKLDSTGTYTGIQVSYFNASMVETDPCASGGLLKFGISATTEIEATVADILAENGRSRVSARGLFNTASPYLDFLTQGLGATAGLNTAKNANVSNIGANQYWLKTNIDTLTTSVTMRYAYHRIEGDLASLKISA